MALTDKLSAIGAAIREKTGSTELMTLDAMPGAIASITTGGGGGEIPAELLKLSGVCDYMFYGGKWDKFVEAYGDQITTENIQGMKAMFSGSDLTHIPFEFNCFKCQDLSEMFTNANMLKTIPAIDVHCEDFSSSAANMTSNMFNGCKNLEEIGTLTGIHPIGLNYFMNNCHRLRNFPEIKDWNYDYMQTYSSNVSLNDVFTNCYSLRNISESLLKNVYCKSNNAKYSMCYGNFKNCYVLDEIRGLRGPTGTITSNMFSGTFSNCYRLKDVIFATQEDGTPYTHNWKSQIIDLSKVGYIEGSISDSFNPILGYNSGLLKENFVYDNNSLVAVGVSGGNNPGDADHNSKIEWTGVNKEYSRYDRWSAVNTINSLPDTSAYGSNTIKFGADAGKMMGFSTGMGNLTETEIAVAAAKGWTVTIV